MVNKITIGIPSEKRSVLRQMEDLLPQIEDGLSRGYSHAVMHAALPEVGINITLPYYHKVLHKLRKERRDRKKSSAPLNIPPAPDEMSHGADLSPAVSAKPVELPTAIAVGVSGQAGTITEGSDGPTLFKYKGKALLDRDWTEF